MQDLRSLIERANTVAEQRAAETYRFMEEQKIKKALGPALWEDLKRLLKDNCDQVMKSSPLRLHFSTDGINDVSVKNLADGRTATLTYNPEVPCVFYKNPGDKGQLTFRVSQDGNSVQFMSGIVALMLDEIVFGTINNIIE